MALIEVGFWRKSKADDVDARPHPSLLQDVVWFREHADLATLVIWYVKSQGCIEAYEMGYSFCRIGSECSSRSMGACTFTDGVYCWPEGYAHYLEKHFVRPPAEFVQHILHKSKGMKTNCLSHHSSQLMMWDYETERPQPVARDMQKIILQNTTIRLKSPMTCWECSTCHVL
jgi:hypothetical protein